MRDQNQKRLHAWLPAGCSVLITLAASAGGITELARAPADHLVRREKDRHIVLIILCNPVGIALVASGTILSLPWGRGPGLCW